MPRRKPKRISAASCPIICILVLLLSFISCAVKKTADTSRIIQSMDATPGTIRQIRTDCASIHGDTGKDFGFCMARTYEQIGAYDLACIWYQGLDEKKAKTMALKQAHKAMQNGQFTQAAYIYETFKDDKNAKAAWMHEAKRLEEVGKYLKAAAIYKRPRVNELTKAKDAYFKLAEELAAKAQDYPPKMRNQILEQAAHWYQEAGDKERASQILLDISSTPL